MDKVRIQAEATLMKIAGITQWSTNSLQKAQLIKNYSANQYDKFVVYGNPEWEVYRTPGFSELIEAATSQNKKVVAISGAYKLLVPLPLEDKVDYEYNPTTFLTSSYSWLHVNPDFMPRYINFYNNDKFKYPFITLNYRAHPHRCEMIDLVYKNNLFEKNKIVWHHKNYEYFQSTEDPYLFKYWKPTQLTLDDGFIENTFNSYKVSEEYFYCFAQLISETTVKSLFLTEKTANALFLKKPFLVASAMGYHNFLTELGFVLYDEIFDYSFDTILDRTKRFDTMLQNFVKLNNLKLDDLTQLYHSISEKLEYNRQRAIELGRNLLFSSPTTLETIKLQNENNISIDPYYFFLMRLLEQANQKYDELYNMSK